MNPGAGIRFRFILGMGSFFKIEMLSINHRKSKEKSPWIYGGIILN